MQMWIRSALFSNQECDRNNHVLCKTSKSGYEGDAWLDSLWTGWPNFDDGVHLSNIVEIALSSEREILARNRFLILRIVLC